MEGLTTVVKRATINVLYWREGGGNVGGFPDTD